jgi:DNA-binding LacI/PurR family transcriptional regulator
MKPSLNARGTLIDIARQVGVSGATVSNAFNRPDQLSAKLREKILATARSLNYSGPNPAARMLRTGFSGTIAVVYPDSLLRPFENPVVTALLGGIADACAENGLALLFQRGGEQSLKVIRNAAVDGLIVFSLPKNDITLQTIKERGLPMVIIDQPRLPKVPLVGIDERASARACAEHLMALGHKSFAIVTFRLGADGYCGFIDRNRVKNSCYELNRVRVSSYLDVLDKGRPEVSVKIWEWLRSNEEGGRIAGENLLKERPRPTAILATSDGLAIGVIEAARACKVRVPQDLAVVGFDDIPAAKLITPPLTTIHQPIAEKGRLAVAALLKEDGPLRIMVPTKLIIRQSSDPATLGSAQETEIEVRTHPLPAPQQRRRNERPYENGTNA